MGDHSLLGLVLPLLVLVIPVQWRSQKFAASVEQSRLALLLIPGDREKSTNGNGEKSTNIKQHSVQSSRLSLVLSRGGAGPGGHPSCGREDGERVSLDGPGEARRGGVGRQRQKSDLKQ